MPLWDEKKESIWMLPGYMNGISAVGGIPIILPLDDKEDTLERMSDMCDGFLFTGGQDISPTVYGSIIKYNNVLCCRERDKMEIVLLKKVLIREKPVLGICRGIQLLNCAMGGTLYQDLPIETESGIEHHQKPPYDEPIHRVKIEKGSPLYKLLNKEYINVNSYHHQAVNKLSS